MLRLVGEVQAAGLTPKELGTLIAQKAAVFLRDPEVTVAVKKIDERVYVGGEVQKPNFVILRERMTPLQAIIEVGGLLETANVENVILIRQGENGYTTHIIDLDDTINQGVPEQFTLAPDDVVYVPRTAIANANIWVRQHITEMLPIRPRIPWGY
jgi:protein involved in polysaccharide export with SLBB domain